MLAKKIGKKPPPAAKTRQYDRTVQQTPKSPIKAPKKTRRKIYKIEDSQYFQLDEIRRLFRFIVDKRDRAIFRLAYHRGLRAHEVGLLQLADFRVRDGVLFVHRGKGSISREHNLTTEELHVLKAWLKERGTMPGPLFPGRLGHGIKRGRLDQLIKHYCELAGIAREKAHMHALKHSCGTHLAERGEQADSIQDWLGHREAKSTAVYMHFSRRRRAEAVERNRDWR